MVQILPPQPKMINMTDKIIQQFEELIKDLENLNDFYHEQRYNVQELKDLLENVKNDKS